MTVSSQLAAAAAAALTFAGSIAGFHLAVADGAPGRAVVAAPPVSAAESVVDVPARSCPDVGHTPEAA